MCGAAKLFPVAWLAALAGPRDLDVDPRAKNSTGRVGVAEEVGRIAALMASDGDECRKAPRIALDRHVVSGCDDHRAGEVGAGRRPRGASRRTHGAWSRD